MNENIKQLISWFLLLAAFVAGVILCPANYAKVAVGMLGLYVLLGYGRTIWRNWEK